MSEVTGFSSHIERLFSSVDPRPSVFSVVLDTQFSLQHTLGLGIVVVGDGGHTLRYEAGLN